MKSYRIFIKTSVFAALACAFFAATLQAQERGNGEPRISPNASVSQTIGTTVVTITYGRPGIRGREIFGGLVPYGEVWRAGANESTNITFSDDVAIEGETVEAGTYSLYTVPGEDEWIIIINSKLSWGTMYDGSQDVIRVTTEPQEAEHRVEQYRIYFEDVIDDSAEIVLHWDTTKVSFTVETI